MKNPRKRILQNAWLRNKVESLTKRMGLLDLLSNYKKTTSEQYYILQLEREMLQISKHLLFMMDLIRRERKRVGLAVELKENESKESKI